MEYGEEKASMPFKNEDKYGGEAEGELSEGLEPAIKGDWRALQNLIGRVRDSLPFRLPCLAESG